ncbi:MAG: hypothetical protein LC713_03285, partial [Actinobacteria bacterium]|nr:hypothetical protein [Actinomycetota bacterium]
MAGIIDGRQWLRDRVSHLRALLDGDPTAEERAAIEAEMDQLLVEASEEGGRSLGRVRRVVAVAVEALRVLGQGG